MKQHQVGFMVGALGTLGLTLCLWSWSAVSAQERSGPQTVVWQAVEIPVSYATDGRSVPGTIVNVVDTAGVCLYISRPISNDWNGPTIAAVPKTQLPKGTGCQ